MLKSLCVENKYIVKLKKFEVCLDALLGLELPALQYKSHTKYSVTHSKKACLHEDQVPNPD